MSGKSSRFWSFSLEVYGDPAVQAECLDLQDRYGIDVNLLLFCAYVGAVDAAAMPESAAQEAGHLVADWHGDVVKNLRAARRALKPFAADPSPHQAAAAAALRGTVKAAELEAERLEQSMLEQWRETRVGTWPRAAPEAAVAANVRLLLATAATAAAAPQPLLPARLIAAALAAARNRQA